MLEYYAVRCCECGMFQCTQKKKVPKFKCKVCGLNQSILKVNVKLWNSFPHFDNNIEYDTRYMPNRIKQRTLDQLSKSITSMKVQNVRKERWKS